MNETVWLIERKDMHMWLMPGLPSRWTNNAAYALKCATEVEARGIIRHPDFHDLHGAAEPTEHIFIDSQSDGRCTVDTNNGDRCILPGGHDGAHSL